MIWIAFRITATFLATLMLTKFFLITWRWWGKDTIHHKFMRNVLKLVIWVAGLFVALSWLPEFGATAGALLAGSGIVALTIGLAAQESLGNLFNGLFMSVFKPLEVGDRIHLVNANITGIIEDLTVRHTVVRTFQNSRIIIPNSVISKELVENSNIINPQASQFIDVVVSYDSDIELARQIMANIIKNHPDFIDARVDKDAPLVPVFVRGLGLHGVELRASMWTASIANSFQACSEVRLELLKEFKNSGIKIATVSVLIS